MKNIIIMLRAGDEARADISLTPERVYYRFATDSSIEDGNLPAIKEDFASFIYRLMSAAEPRESETPLDKSVKFEMYVDTRVKNFAMSEESLRRLISILCEVSDEFLFLRGFC